MATNAPWTGQWVTDRLGVALHGEVTPTEPVPLGLRDLLGLALRRNPRRAHLLVSHVLGKHVPQRPDIVYGHAHALGVLVRALLGAEADRAVVVGYAETATGLGHAVADGIGAVPYLHSTRRPVPGARSAGGFEEEHSHATSHLLLPRDPELLAGPGPLVLVDDEFSTGRTIMNTVGVLHARHPRERYVVVALTDMRAAADHAALADFAAGLGARVDVVALAAGTVTLPADVLAKGAALVTATEAAAAEAAVRSGAEAAARAHAQAVVRSGGAGAGRPDPGAGAVTRVDLGWPAGLPDGARHGFWPRHRRRLEDALPAMGARLAAALPVGARRVLVLGTEELMYAPLRLAQALQHALDPAGGRDGGPGPAGPGPGHQDLAGPGPDPAAGPKPAAGRGPGAGEAAGPDPEAPEVRYSTTTRSPVLAVDDPGYAIRSRLVFPAHDDPADGGSPERYAYNVAGAGFDAVVCVVDSAGDTPALHAPGGLLAALAGHTGAVVLAVVPSWTPPAPGGDGPDGGAAATGTATEPVPATGPVKAAASVSATAPVTAAASVPATGPVTATESVSATDPVPAAEPVPATPTAEGNHRRMSEPLRGPAFSSYAPDEVGWLLKDLSGVELEAPVEEREEAVQSGGAHYAESLPVEYQPTAEYQELFRSALAASAGRVARAVGAVTELVLAERGPDAVLVSLARAGTPVGVLMRRWARRAHGLDLPHYAVSIVRGRGIDANALRWLAAHHDPADAVFVDGWTGKGAITRELAAALRDFPGFDPDVAVLADPGGCVPVYGTRDDFLIPSACLNSTVSGLISRTVLRDDLIGPRDFHGAKFYRELSGADVSALFLDSVTAAFDGVAEAVAEDVKALRAQDRRPTWEGWHAVERISERYGIGDVNLVKPGVGETTRVLLRRVPWRVLARRGAGADLDHVRLLAEQRGVPVEEVGDLPYSCVGLIHPRYTRGATGTDGRAVGAA